MFVLVAFRAKGARGEGHMAGTEPLLIGIDSLIMKCGIMVLILHVARDTTHKTNSHNSLRGAGVLT